MPNARGSYTISEIRSLQPGTEVDIELMCCEETTYTASFIIDTVSRRFSCMYLPTTVITYTGDCGKQGCTRCAEIFADLTASPGRILLITDRSGRGPECQVRYAGWGRGRLDVIDGEETVILTPDPSFEPPVHNTTQTSQNQGDQTSTSQGAAGGQV
ncbi:hypothetical protein TREMEDRAFT_58790 [Tremella mesenterica DSM 1558]|uniref:uncharacterized protein n=1 Tax=Tremella mesenterica (strain ATCC 24925 / CBS 8224 / DSM 1558 / NBRC 9311 / NRRL Y-6157 / RJB 2259-6 / UBC 559-6) TaxID=578456 RepID=UPI0003F48C81|nr:uncharacterized protein TREMEDRAFT_58790 [Tremella mesenterica DSM 1558]EIW72620.1 hypothetical protein TREMEDRAFT_58790 [Tremella mesenterica DSM 1558]